MRSVTIKIGKIIALVAFSSAIFAPLSSSAIAQPDIPLWLTQFLPADPLATSQPLLHVVRINFAGNRGPLRFETGENEWLVLISNMFTGQLTEVFLTAGNKTAKGAIFPMTFNNETLPGAYNISFKKPELAAIKKLTKADLLIKETSGSQTKVHRFVKALSNPEYLAKGAYWKIKKQRQTLAGQEVIWDRQSAYTTKVIELTPGKEIVVQEKLKINAKNLKTGYWIQNVSSLLPAIVNITLNSGGQAVYETGYFAAPTNMPQRLILDAEGVVPKTYKLMLEGANPIYLITTYPAKSLRGYITGLWKTIVGD